MNLKKSTGRTSSVSNAARINPKSSEIDIETWPLSKNPITEEDKTQGMLADRVLDDYMVSILPSAGKEKYTTPEELKRDLEFLNRKLETVRKTITAWDVYNISGVAKNVEEVNQLLNTLTPNSSFIVNIPQTYIANEHDEKNKQEYSAGDIVFQDVVGKNHVIKAQGAGVFFPQNLDQLFEIQLTTEVPKEPIQIALWNKIKDKQNVALSEITLSDDELKQVDPTATEESLTLAIQSLITNSTFLNATNTYKLTYTFSQIIPNEKDKPQKMGPEAPIKHQMYTNLISNAETQPYGQHITITDINNPYEIEIENNIQPIIYTFLIDNQNHYERIWLDDSFYQTTVIDNKITKITITKPNTIDQLYVEVR